MKKKQSEYAICLLGPIWVLRIRKRFLFIPYWKDIYSSPFLEDVENLLNEINENGTL